MTSTSLSFTWSSQSNQDANTAKYTAAIKPTIFLDSLKYEVALIGLQTFYSFPNISEGLISTELTKASANGILISGDINTLHVKIKLISPYTVDFT